MYILFVAAVLATIVVFLPRNRDFIASCEELMRKMPRTDYESMCQFANGSAKERDTDFWDTSQRVKGLWNRLRVSYLCLRLVQAFRREGHLNRADARKIWSMLAGQTIYSFIALPEAIACHMFKSTRHIAARESLRFYCDLVIETNVKCFIKEAPLCVMVLPELL